MAERRYQMVFFSAVAVALAATVGVYRVLEKTKESSKIITQPVVIAAQDVPEGMKFERLALSVVEWPANAAPAGSYSSLDSVVGRVAKIPVFKGEPIVPGRLAPPGTGPGLEVKITPGKRAMAIKINDVVGIAGMIRPDSRVDVLVTLKEDINAPDNRKRAKLFMSNMRVLSVGADVSKGDDGKPINATTAALEVTPEEAERLAIAMNQGTIQLVLRGYGDPDSIRTAAPRRAASLRPAAPAAGGAAGGRRAAQGARALRHPGLSRRKGDVAEGRHLGHQAAGLVETFSRARLPKEPRPCASAAVVQQ
jgi:pilus assembly protein CpaB